MNIIQFFVLIFCCFSVVLSIENESPEKNITTPKDMIVVRATVYQVGILTNQTNETEPNTGHQEALTIYRGNGSNIDLSALPQPLLTNVTAEKVVGVAPLSATAPWDALKKLVSRQDSREKINPPMAMETGISKREVSKPMQVLQGAAVLPSEAGLQSIALPPLLTLNRNLSSIPVPIPNVSVVSYAKVNTLVHSP